MHKIYKICQFVISGLHLYAVCAYVINSCMQTIYTVPTYATFTQTCISCHTTLVAPKNLYIAYFIHNSVWTQYNHRLPVSTGTWLRQCLLLWCNVICLSWIDNVIIYAFSPHCMPDTKSTVSPKPPGPSPDPPSVAGNDVTDFACSCVSWLCNLSCLILTLLAGSHFNCFLPD